MEITEKIEKLIFSIFDNMIEGAEKYITNDSLWLIFTDQQRWVFEFNNRGTLWYNYNMIQSELDLIGMDNLEIKPTIKKWFESRFLVKSKRISRASLNIIFPDLVKDAIENGVKKVISDVGPTNIPKLINDVIQNGIKDIGYKKTPNESFTNDIIENGVKDIGARHLRVNNKVKDVIDTGVKDVYGVKSFGSFGNTGVIGAIKNGEKEIVVKQSYLGHINDNETMATTLEFSNKIDDAIENGVKE